MKRKKIWEISHDYLCSVIGTCLSLEDVRNAFARAGHDLPGDMTDYEIHGMAVHTASDFCRFSNKLNEMLERKHCADIHRASACENAAELKAFWEESFDEGNISGAYWALISHPECTKELLNHAFGQIHMLCHITGAGERTRREEINKHLRRIEELGAELKKYKNRLSQKSLDLRKAKTEYGTLKKEYETFQVRYARLWEDTEMKRQEASGPSEIAGVKRKLKETEAQRDGFKAELARRAEEAEQLRECNSMLRELLRRSFHRPCEEYGSAVGGYTGIIDLRNKTVLLVGGRTSSIPQYRSLVEVMNGTCVHHDGGQEQSMTVLQNLVPRADIIVCFLNCVSHDASKCVKKSFKSEKQRIIMLKNSGLSSFKRELEKYAS
jgi:hypothetical protein